MCGQGEMWRGFRMSLVLDHVNGVCDDNRLENLRFLCPNCNATLDTHCGRKNRREVAGSRLRVLRGATAEVRQAALLLAAVRRAPQRAGAAPRRAPALRATDGRDRRDELLAVGRKYGVSDNAIRKWVRAYERERGT